MKPAGRSMTLGFALAVALLTLNASADARGDRQHTGRALTDSSDVAAVVTRHHAALASGDSAAALALLTDDAVILDGSHVEAGCAIASGSISVGDEGCSPPLRQSSRGT